MQVNPKANPQAIFFQVIKSPDDQLREYHEYTFFTLKVKYTFIYITDIVNLYNLFHWKVHNVKCWVVCYLQVLYLVTKTFSRA